MESICSAYWYPIYAYVRCRGQSPADAEDLTQEFFRRLLEKRWLDSADPDKGRLRTFLVVAVQRFMAREWRRASAERRGGGRTHVPIDTRFAESRYATDAPAGESAEQAFDRQWAMTLMEITLQRLRAEFEQAGRAGQFEVLKQCLTAERGALDYAGVARDLGLSPGAARVAVHRFRKRFRAVYREEISRTLAEGADLGEELRHLADAVSRA